MILSAFLNICKFHVVHDENALISCKLKILGILPPLKTDSNSTPWKLKFATVKFRKHKSLKVQSNHHHLFDWTVSGVTLKVKLLVSVLLTIYSARDRICVPPPAHGGTRRAAASLAGSWSLLNSHTTRLGTVPIAGPLRPSVDRFICGQKQNNTQQFSWLPTSVSTSYSISSAKKCARAIMIFFLTFRS